MRRVRRMRWMWRVRRLRAGTGGRGEQLRAVYRSPSCARVPARARGVWPTLRGYIVVAGRDVSVSLPGNRRPVQERVCETEARLPLRDKRLVDAGNQAGVERSDGASPADRKRLAVDPDVVAGLGIGIAGNVGNPTTGMPVVPGGRNLCVCLIGRWRKESADAAAGRSLPGTVVPDRLVGDASAGGDEARAAAGDNVGARCRKIDMELAVLNAIG
jgi:hypothetical protein